MKDEENLNLKKDGVGEPMVSPVYYILYIVVMGRMRLGRIRRRWI